MKLPADFIVRTKALLGDEWDAFEQALNADSPTSIRLNPFKRPIPNPKESAISLPCMQGEGGDAGTVPVPWASNAYYLEERPSFTLDPLFHAGNYYVQEASSMALETIIQSQVTQPVRVLDLCAAPGGKSTQLSAVLPEGSLLVANEVIRTRANILSENLTKWGNPHTIVSNNDPAEIGKLGAFFDVIVVDAPCSGEGMFRKDPASIGEWSVANVRLCAERQRRIVADVWPTLRPGGLLIYSTCTYNRDENEENIFWMCRELGASVVEEPRRFMPHRTKGEGFFIAAVRKPDSAPVCHCGRDPQSLEKKRHHADKGGAVAWRVAPLLANPDQFRFFEDKTGFTAIPIDDVTDYLFLQVRLKIISAGVLLGEMKGKDFIPSHSLAMSCALSPDAFPTLELDKTTALIYLKKEALQNVAVDLPKGHILVTYLGCPLGFVKNIGNRANNLYPHKWRVRMNLV
ncbi:rRNA cytosine-C5-methyltransferase [Bacteroidia bacterium]|nr:rRNA cytosine-C5-methyltransferase [Bacteroidia bacterium]